MILRSHGAMQWHCSPANTHLCLFTRQRSSMYIHYSCTIAGSTIAGCTREAGCRRSEGSPTAHAKCMRVQDR